MPEIPKAELGDKPQLPYFIFESACMTYIHIRHGTKTSRLTARHIFSRHTYNKHKKNDGRQLHAVGPPIIGCAPRYSAAALWF